MVLPQYRKTYFKCRQINSGYRNRNLAVLNFRQISKKIEKAKLHALDERKQISDKRNLVRSTYGFCMTAMICFLWIVCFSNQI